MHPGIPKIPRGRNIEKQLHGILIAAKVKYHLNTSGPIKRLKARLMLKSFCG